MKCFFSIKRFILLFIIGGIANLTAGEKKQTLLSPNGKIRIEVCESKSAVEKSSPSILTYEVYHNEKRLLSSSNIGLKLKDTPLKIGKITSINRQRRTEQIDAPFYRTPSFQAHYNVLNLRLSGKAGLGIEFRAYDEGVSYRFYSTTKNELNIENELAEFNFEEDYPVHLSHSTNTDNPLAMAFQNTYEYKPLSESSDLLAFLPATIDYDDGIKLTLLESDLEAYPGMFLQAAEKTLKGVFAPLPADTDFYPWRMQEYVTTRHETIAKSNGARTLPWRIMAITEKDTDMPTNNLVYALASPNRIGDYSWVTPGKVAWDWWNDWGLIGVDFKAGINMDTYKYHIDFASRFGLEYVILDEGWYNPQSGDMLTVIPELDIPELVSYAKDRGVRLILWTVFNVLDTQLEEACRIYSEMGIAGFKIDFLDRDDQTAVEMTYRIAEATAKYKLLLNLHGFYKPTGLNRTFPHIVNFEGVFGMEEAKWSTIEKDMPRYDVTFPFIRMMCGPVDFTPGAMRNGTKRDFKPIYNNPMSQGTRCHQLAMYVAYDSPLTMLCDAPSCYEREEAYTRFLASIPQISDETRVIDGELGEYIVIARRKNKNWYVGGMTNWDPREISLDLSFLKKDKQYIATMFIDGKNADKQGTDYQQQVKEVNANGFITIQMAPGGGFVIRFEECVSTDELPKTVPLHLGLDSFYKKYIDADGIAIVSSEKVRDEALQRVARVIAQIVSKRKDIRNYMINKGCKVMIIGEHEEVCYIPEYQHICDSPENIAFWNKRARGFGGSPEHDFSASCGEENVLGFTTDRYYTESIVVHEFAHIFHLIGIAGIELDFNNRLEALHRNAISKGLWENTYAISNKEEYFAEAVQSFFNCNRFASPSNGVHNAINNRSKLKVYDPDMYELLLNYLPEIDLDLVNSQLH